MSKIIITIENFRLSLKFPITFGILYWHTAKRKNNTGTSLVLENGSGSFLLYLHWITGFHILIIQAICITFAWFKPETWRRDPFHRVYHLEHFTLILCETPSCSIHIFREMIPSKLAVNWQHYHSCVYSWQNNLHSQHSFAEPDTAKMSNPTQPSPDKCQFYK